MLMVKAGAPVDEFIDLLLPFLDKGDIIIDGGIAFSSILSAGMRPERERHLLYWDGDFWR